MNILFLTLSQQFLHVEEPGIYTDLMKYFRDKGHNVYVVMPFERRFKKPTALSETYGFHILGVKTLNVQKTNMIEKGLSYVLLERQFANGIRKYLKGIRFDIVLYSTPPITLAKAVEFVKKRDGAKSYLMLKDIFPQNAIDIGLMSKNALWKFFLKKEQNLYQVSDYIGCMSPRNCEYLLEQNPWVDKNIVEVCPNSEFEEEVPNIDKKSLREKYGLPQDKIIMVYGGNLGKPQGIDFLVEAMRANKNNDKVFFLIVGAGTEYHKLEEYIEADKPYNVSLHKFVPRNEYEEMVRACDIGLIMLDKRFTIPNYPSRIIAYMKNRMPVLTATDHSTDIGTLAEENGYGFAAWSDDVESFNNGLKKYTDRPEIMKEMGENGYKFFKNNYTIKHTYDIIMKHFEHV